MNQIFLGIAAMAFAGTACNNSQSSSTKPVKTDTAQISPANSDTVKQPVSLGETTTAYLQLKNALVSDDTKEAASAGKQLQDALIKLEQASFSDSQKKVFDEVRDDMEEHAEHISANAGNIKHQREHFDMLSRDMYDLTKAVKPSQALYRTYCPMFNGGKGAYWLSESKDVKNPYYGQKMSGCGEVKDEIKP